MIKVPEVPVFKPSSSSDKTIMCWSPDATDEDKEHDIIQVNKFIASQKAKSFTNPTKQTLEEDK